MTLRPDRSAPAGTHSPEQPSVAETGVGMPGRAAVEGAVGGPDPGPRAEADPEAQA